MPNNHKRMLAEWENPSAILLALPNSGTDWAPILSEATGQYARLIRALTEGGEKLIVIRHPEEGIDPELKKLLEDQVVTEDITYNDTWTRDYGSITVEEDERLRELDFGFNGWGLKFASNFDNLVNRNLALRGYRTDGLYENHRDFTLEGGSIETDGKGTVLTTTRCLCSPNRNGGKEKREIEEILKERLGAERVLWLDFGFLAGDDTDSHVDTLARMAPNDTIIYVAPPVDEEDEHFVELQRMEGQLKEFRTSEGLPYRLIPLPFPDPIFDEDGERLPATYANYLVTGKNLYIPVYGQPDNDRLAVERIGDAFPGHKVFTVDCRTLIRQHGSLHCSTMQLYDRIDNG